MAWGLIVISVIFEQSAVNYSSDKQMKRNVGLRIERRPGMCDQGNARVCSAYRSKESLGKLLRSYKALQISNLYLEAMHNFCVIVLPLLIMVRILRILPSTQLAVPHCPFQFTAGLLDAIVAQRYCIGPPQLHPLFFP
jgi:hypothetical protein